MKNYSQFEILNLSEPEINNELIGKTYKFTLNSKTSIIDSKKFVANIIDLELSSENKPYSLKVSLEESNNISEVLILNIFQLKYVC